MNIMNVSWGDCVGHGEGDGRLASIESIKRRMAAWKEELGVNQIQWRHIPSHFMIKGRTEWSRALYTKIYQKFFDRQSLKIDWQPLDVVPGIAHSMGMEASLYSWLFDEGWPLLPAKIRKNSYHTKGAQHTAAQTIFSKKHSEYTRVDRTGKNRQWGVLSLSYPEVRAVFQNRYMQMLKTTNFDGLFLCLRSQSRPADFADQYEFNEPIRKEYLHRYGKDIIKEDFDLQLWRDLLGEYLTLFIKELRGKLLMIDKKLSIGVPVGDILGPPMGNTTLNWQKWIREGLIDKLIVNQSSSICPAQWNQLWPMHRGYGYLQNYIDGYNLPPLIPHIESRYAPHFRKFSCELYIACQWRERFKKEEAVLSSILGVNGLVYNAFRFDNPEACIRADWLNPTRPRLITKKLIPIE